MAGTTSPGAFDPNSAGVGSADASAPSDVGSLWGSGVSSTDIGLPVTLTNDVGPGPQTNSGPSDNHYVEKPQSGTVGQALRDLYSFTDQQYQALQQQLYQSGFWTSTKPPRLGDKSDLATYDAWKNAVIVAARSGMSIEDVINDSVNGGQPGGPGTTNSTRVYPGGKVNITFTNPDDIRNVGNTVAQRLLGRNLTDAEAKGVVDSVHAQEQTAGTQKAQADESQKEAQIATQEALYGQQGTAGGSGGSTDVVQAITQAANQLGVPVQVAIAIAQQESGLDPNAVGDNGHSIGLFQLYDQGEGAGMTDAQRRDPLTNAMTALKEVAAVAQQHPGWSWGQIAAAAQRPADQAGYAASVNAKLQAAGAPVQGTAPGGKNGGTTDVFLQPTISDVSQPANPDSATQAYLNQNDSTEMQTFGLTTQFNNFSQALHSMPGDSGAAKPSRP